LLDDDIEEEYCIVLIHISVNWDDVTDSGVPQIESLAYQDMRGDDIIEHKALVFSGRTLMQEWRLKFKNKNVVLMSVQNDCTIPLVLANLLEHAEATTNELESLVSGVCDFRTFMAKMGEEEFFSSYQSLETMPITALVQLVTKILRGAIGNPRSYDNFLTSFGQRLDGPYFNRQLLNSQLRIFGENQVRLFTTKTCVLAPETICIATSKVVSPWKIPRDSKVKIFSSSLSFLELEVENLLDVSNEFTVKVEMLNVEFEDMTIPADTEIARGELIKNSESVYVIEPQQKLFVRTDLLANTNYNLEIMEENGDPMRTPHCYTQQEGREESQMMDQMTDKLLVTRLGFF